jgi:hypothetical protein
MQRSVSPELLSLRNRRFVGFANGLAEFKINGVHLAMLTNRNRNRIQVSKPITVDSDLTKPCCDECRLNLK